MPRESITLDGLIYRLYVERRASLRSHIVQSSAKKVADSIRSGDFSERSGCRVLRTAHQPLFALTQHSVLISWGDLDWSKTGLARGDVEWIDNGKRFLWANERNGWRHIYAISRDGREVKDMTPGNFDVINVEKVDDVSDWIYFEASTAKSPSAPT